MGRSDKFIILHDCAPECPYCAGTGIGEIPDSSCPYCYGSGVAGRRYSVEIVLDLQDGELVPDTCKRCGQRFEEEISCVSFFPG